MKKAALAWLIVLVLGLALACQAGKPATPTPSATPPPADTTPMSLPPSLTPPPMMVVTVVFFTPTPTPTPAPAPTPALPLPDLVSVVERVRPAVVSIRVQALQLYILGRQVPAEGAGSGVILDPSGYILTNNHVIEGAQEIEVSLPDGRVFPGRLVGADRLADLAVVKVEGQDLPVARLASTAPQVGEWVVAIGNALALKGGPTVTEGVVSSLGRSIRVDNNTLYDLIQTSAAINPGNSGGPLINLRGEVVGINTAIASGEGIGFAIGTGTAQAVYDELKSRGKVAWPFLGVVLDDVTPALASQQALAVTQGAILTEVTTGYPAYEAGLRPGDVIISFQGEEVKSADRLIVLLRQFRAGDKVSITYYRGEERHTVSLTLVPRPD